MHKFPFVGRSFLFVGQPPSFVRQSLPFAGRPLPFAGQSLPFAGQSLLFATFRLLLAGFSLCALLPSSALAEHWVVDPSGGGDFTHIQPAIEAATPGDEIEVLAGTYAEELDYLGKDLRVFASQGPDVTVLTPPVPTTRSTHLVTFASGEGSAASLEGFTLSASSGPLVASLGGTGGGAIGCYGSEPQILGCVFLQNEADYGGGILLIDANPTISGCTFLENLAHISGSAIAGPNSAPSILECRFEDNEAVTGSGTVQLALPCDIVACEFINNRAHSGGAISCPYDTANLLIKGCTFESNQSTVTHGGAIRIHEASPTIESCTFVDNRAALDGGAIFTVDGGSAELRHCTFYFNLAQRSGGHLAVLNGATPLIENCILSEALGGYGVFVDSALPAFVCNAFWNNHPLNFLNFEDPSGTDGNFTADPLFCDVFSYDFTIDTNSPCAEENNPLCGQIGRFGVACGGVRCHCISWGHLRTRFDPRP